MTKPINGKITTEGLQLPSACDICGKSRAHGSHVKCSKIRQAQYQAKRAAK
ncbi:TPA: hypothetical protein SMS86_006208 [Pseudomonas aeruginosa]|uniref:hypothetical protein n=1 Tax=Pseudomonas aeruginosa TaxID=287 RepID=UPI001404D225|nr:hypothetical protein [Pseudomonas aeruginosa]EJQ7925629.1 hypothetical protein [Pseudomonas aeruginosa]EKW6756758.1 hypothetical protein [Pseudomonas aeruginosa]EKY2866429.1 hypothetical protein [Pseudomonas aeruginosa]HCF4818146.1 hypothetical protein [Pseudomonas aeruginosa]HEK2334649.1 hypothetical protein [Pseudomonas aeruginosa]